MNRLRTAAVVLGACLLGAPACDDTPPSVAAVASPSLRFDEPPTIGSDAWILADVERYLEDRRFRRRVLEASLTNPDNLYSRSRLASYALAEGGWDALPEWNPRTRPIDDALVAEISADGDPRSVGEAPRLWDGERPRDMAGWVELGRRVFFEYPLRPEVFAEHALANPEVAARVGLRQADDGTWPGVVAFEDVDGRARVGITCALCHVAIEGGTVIPGAARRELDYGQMRLAYHHDTGAPLPEALAQRMARWGPGRADITEDDDEDPVAIVDLWGVRERRFLTQAATLQHVHPAAVAIRQETQILHANRERARPPRELAWALAMYVYSLAPPRRDPVVADARGEALFDQHCRSCHDDPTGAGEPVAAATVGTDASLAFGAARGTGMYRPSPLIRVADAAPYLHHGVVDSLDALLDPARFEPAYRGSSRKPGPVPGHRYGTGLPAGDRAALVAYLGTL